MSIAENHGGLYSNLQLLRETEGKAENNFFKTWGFDYLFLNEGNNIKKLIDNILRNGNLKHFDLSWFGGEPLMYFEEVVYPISSYLLKRSNECGITFSNSITTNGFLLNPSMIKKCVEINLNHYQITLDGNRDMYICRKGTTLNDLDI